MGSKAVIRAGWGKQGKCVGEQFKGAANIPTIFAPLGVADDDLFEGVFRLIGNGQVAKESPASAKTAGSSFRKNSLKR